MMQIKRNSSIARALILAVPLLLITGTAHAASFPGGAADLEPQSSDAGIQQETEEQTVSTINSEPSTVAATNEKSAQEESSEQKITPRGGVVINPVDTRVSNVSKKYETNMGQVLAQCNVARDYVSCTINKTVSATRTVQLGGGLSRGTISTQLGFNSSASVSTSVSCTSPRLMKGQSFKAYPAGYKYSYRVATTSILGTSYSGWLSAFNPLANHITCK